MVCKFLSLAAPKILSLHSFTRKGDIKHSKSRVDLDVQNCCSCRRPYRYNKVEEMTSDMSVL
jgi:hypothetical protein